MQPVSKRQLDDLALHHIVLRSQFRWQQDLKTFRQFELWGRPVRAPDGALVGDCDDWVREMDFIARHRGVPLGALRYASCRMTPGQKHRDHLVLVVMDENKRLWASDCNRTTLAHLKRLPYDMWIWNRAGEALTEPWEVIPLGDYT